MVAGANGMAKPIAQPDTACRGWNTPSVLGGRGVADYGISDPRRNM